MNVRDVEDEEGHHSCLMAVSCIIQLKIHPLEDGHYYQAPTSQVCCSAWIAWEKQHFSQEQRMMRIVMDSQLSSTRRLNPQNKLNHCQHSGDGYMMLNRRRLQGSHAS